MNSYYNLKRNHDNTIMDFKSIGPKGKICKRILFNKLDKQNVYSLSFGTFCKCCKRVDFESETKNKDMAKVLNTVIRATQEFLLHKRSSGRPYVYFVGNTPAKQRVYRMILAKGYLDYSQHYEIMGIRKKKTVRYIKGANYDGFLIAEK